MANSQAQAVLALQKDSWTFSLSTNWNILGPFPIQAREQQYLSPSFPLNLTEPIDFDASWPSSYADGGRVSWSQAESDSAGNLNISFPSVRWDNLRSTEGWVALQHHALLRTTFTIHPPLSGSVAENTVPNLLVNLVQGSYFTVLPADNTVQDTPKWYAGNIYDMERALPHVVTLPRPISLDKPTTFQLFVSGDYEIRLFGDPRARNSEVPIQQLRVNIDLETPALTVVHEDALDVVCDFVDGYAFGDAVGVGIRSVSGWWTVQDAKTSGADGLELQLQKKIRLAPSQALIAPLKISQTKPFEGKSVCVELTLTSSEPEDAERKLTITLPVNQLPLWSSKGAESEVVKGTYFYAKHIPTIYLAKPPKLQNGDNPGPPILAAHGAGVDIIGKAFGQMWADALPQKDHSWIVIVSGRTSWGLDWHGPSAQDSWASLDALTGVLARHDPWNPWRIADNARAVVLGHSNGGQGAWYLASRYPDRVLAVAPASGYIKSQAYVPLTLSRSAHFIDPALRGILETSLTPDDNDLFLSNLVDTPVFAIHGGDDNNVPVWHGRELVSALQYWNRNSSVIFKEDPGKPHWYPEVFDNERVQAWLDQILETHQPTSSNRFTLTVALPADSGSLHGWRIDQLLTPGRLGRLTVQVNEIKGKLQVQVVTSNVKAFSLDTTVFRVSSDALWVDKARIAIPKASADTVSFRMIDFKIWKVSTTPNTLQRSGRMQSILTSDHAPLVFVIPDTNNEKELSVATRIAHDLQLYHRLAVEILQDTEISTNVDLGNLVVIGPRDATMATIEAHSVEGFAFKPRPGSLDAPGLGLLYMHQHPTNKHGKMLIIESTDESGLERAARLFPVRTGIAVPDWVVVGPEADKVGAAGVMAAGVWDSDWSFNPVMSWVY